MNAHAPGGISANMAELLSELRASLAERALELLRLPFTHEGAKEARANINAARQALEAAANESTTVYHEHVHRGHDAALEGA